MDRVIDVGMQDWSIKTKLMIGSRRKKSNAVNVMAGMSSNLTITTPVTDWVRMPLNFVTARFPPIMNMVIPIAESPMILIGFVKVSVKAPCHPKSTMAIAANMAIKGGVIIFFKSICG